MSPITVYGIPNCDQVRGARAWLRARHIDHRFHDLRSDGLDAGRLADWLAQTSWEVLLNRRGLAWRKLDPARRALAVDADGATGLLLADPTLVKRPVLEHPGGLTVGFSEATYEDLFGARP